MLTPRGSLFIDGDAAAVKRLREQAVSAGFATAEAEKNAAENEGADAAPWLCLVKPAPDGLGDWSHWEHGPDNNPVSEDAVIKAPYMTQFLAEPYYIAMPSVTTAAGGRTFLAVGHIAHHRREWDGMNKIIARNGFNGSVLWERKLPEGYLVHRSAFIATDDVFYMMDGDRALLIDPETGAGTGRSSDAGRHG